MSSQATADLAPTRRRYDNSRRRQQVEATREAIAVAGAEILHETSVRDWRGLTIRAVAERAGVSERTVYRHFENERGLRDAVMARLEEEANVDLANLTLEEFPQVAGRVLSYVASYPTDAKPPLDPTLSATSRRRREALLGAVSHRAQPWPEDDRVVAAAILDLLWSASAFEHLLVDWQMDSEQAADGIAWVAGLVEEAVREGRSPLGPL